METQLVETPLVETMLCVDWLFSHMYVWTIQSKKRMQIKKKCNFKIIARFAILLPKHYQKIVIYSHLSNNRGGWNKRAGVQKLQNQLDFFQGFSINFYARIKIYSSK